MPKEAKPKTTRKSATAKRAKKDPNAPKRGLSAYMFFANDCRDSVRKDNPGISFGEVGKVLGDKWKNMTAKDKTPYEAKAKVDKERYISEMKAYKENGEGGDGGDESEE